MKNQPPTNPNPTFIVLLPDNSPAPTTTFASFDQALDFTHSLLADNPTLTHATISVALNSVKILNPNNHH